MSRNLATGSGAAAVPAGIRAWLSPPPAALAVMLTAGWAWLVAGIPLGRAATMTSAAAALALVPAAAGPTAGRARRAAPRRRPRGPRAPARSRARPARGRPQAPLARGVAGGGR